MAAPSHPSPTYDAEAEADAGDEIPIFVEETELPSGTSLLSGDDDAIPFEDSSLLSEDTPSGVFTESRRLGARKHTKFSAFLLAGGRRYRARTVELSTTGVVLDFHYSSRPELDGLQTLELAVPGSGQPIRTLARPVRRVGNCDAFEFLSIREVDRLTLAEHLDRERRLGY